MMHMETPPRLIETRLRFTMPDKVRRKGDLHLASNGDGGARTDRPYITESSTGSALVADVSGLNS
ncbi:hypothetical protein [Bradyrhizobium tunisiense]|jgi:hypothetical protein|uniref:hypothetical protein n=1 Tax=Bradyrhizobium tunisiense TaxID=3278709 RepID=UPI0035DEEF74